jgi:hypothetical protein
MNLSQEDRDLKQQLDQAWQLFVACRWDDALHLWQSVLLIDPDSVMANWLN